MLNVKVLGPGCPRCRQVHKAVVEALAELEAEMLHGSPELTLQHTTDHGESFSSTNGLQ